MRIEFLDAASSPTVLYDSPAVTAADSLWTQYFVTTDLPPPGTSYVAFCCFVEKPASILPGRGIANFDDCSLETATVVMAPRLHVSPQCVGLAKTETQRSFKIKNPGMAPLNWQAKSNETWIQSLSPQSGATAPNGESTITLTVSRASLTQQSCKGLISINSNAGNQAVIVYMEMPGYVVPDKPSVATVSGHRLIVRKRLHDGSLDGPKPYVIRGAAWSPVGIGDTGDFDVRRRAFRKWYVADIQLLKEMNANTVYTFVDFGTEPNARDILDNLHKNGIMAIVTVDEGENSTPTIAAVVAAYRNHPAVLAWAIGNEWNINLYHDKFGDLDSAAKATEKAAIQIKALDSSHPVISVYGEITVPSQAKTQEIVNLTCRNVDIWGLNIYRGPTFGDLFSVWASITTRPMVLTEFGTDSYRTAYARRPFVGFEDENVQAQFDAGLWQEIAANLSAQNAAHVCLGGTVFQWNDEWWKVESVHGGSPYVHDNEGFITTWSPVAHPDSVANEEYFGIVDIERRRKQAYFAFRELFGAFTTSAANWALYP